MKSIPYTKKVTTASTQYRKMRKSDVDWIIDQCKQIVSVITTCESGPADLRSIAQTLNTPSVLMPKQSTGKRNSTKSMCEGVVDNFNSTQYDLSDKTCIGVTEAFRQAADIFDTFEEVTFEEVTTLPKLTKPNLVDQTSNTNFGDLFGITRDAHNTFEVESITIKYTRK